METIDLIEGEGIYAPINRMGGKQYLKKRIVKLIPTEGVNTYVEPFAGGGKIFLELPHPYPHEVLNDLDKMIYFMWKDIKQVGISSIEKMDFTPSREKFNHLKSMTKFSSPAQRLYRNLYINQYSYIHNNLSYFNQGSLQYKERLLKTIGKLKERLADVVILNQDFRKVIRKYDSPTTFFYIDPPYFETTGYGLDIITPEDVYNSLKNIKGRFLLSYNNHPKVRKAFKDYKIKRIKTRHSGSLVGTTSVWELLISNY